MSNIAILTLGAPSVETEGGSSPPEQTILDRIPPEWQHWADTWDVSFIAVPGEAGDIPVKLYLPPDHGTGRTYPLLIWAHGAGYAQTAKRDPGFYEVFHPWAAAELGWIVAEVDYRGSSGYGRDWRVDVWGRLGHGEVDDLVAVKHFMVEQFGADPRRTAIWGWSYGGFLTLMALGLAPGEFPVGCAVAPAIDWENYYYWYSTCRLGHPDENPDEYELSDATTYLENITDDLLILHGMRDSNTLFQTVAQYLEKSHELGINVELKLFPSDSHGMGNEQHYLRVYEAIVDYCLDHWPQVDGNVGTE
ncbi:S9 family peptidase [bacterium]|nr:S9 family peptidase [bacterium]